MNNYLITLVGPTAVGKTLTAILLAKYFNTKIISADSRQFYKEINIGTAKPSDDELQQVTHYFINNLSVFDTYSVGAYEQEALICLDNIFKTNKIAILVGGSGLYINAVLNGFDKFPEPSQSLRQEIIDNYTTKGLSYLQNTLSQLDPLYFAQVDTQNPQRMMRAIEVCLSGKKPYSTYKTDAPKPRNFIPIKIGLNLPRPQLYAQINLRVLQMIDKGLITEAQQWHPYKHLNALQTVGYTELFNAFENQISIASAIELIQQHTRNYAKRQLTWFGKDIAIEWFLPNNTQQIIAHINQIINNS